MQVKFWPYSQIGVLGVISEGQISLNFNYSQFQRFLYQTLCVFSQIKDIKHIDRNFHSVTILGLGGCWGVKNLSMGICDETPSTACSSWQIKREIKWLIWFSAESCILNRYQPACELVQSDHCHQHISYSLLKQYYYVWRSRLWSRFVLFAIPSLRS